MSDIMLTGQQQFIIEIVKTIAPYVVAIIGLLSAIIVPFCTKNLELEKHRKQFLYEKKYNAYTKYLSIFDDYWHTSRDFIVGLEQLNKNKYETKHDFELYKQNVANLCLKHIEISDYLSMPGLEILIFTNEKIQSKITEITELDANSDLRIDTKAELEQNMLKAKAYIKVLRELSELLMDDLKIKEIK